MIKPRTPPGVMELLPRDQIAFQRMLDAIRRTFGTTLSDVSLGLPRQPIAVESILDPKKRLGEAYNATKPTTRRRRQGSSAILDSLGEAISLGRLRQLEAFRTLESELREALHKLNVLR